ncbi:hypothetical protein, partial [Nocardia farcinica]|uniref:hypothetical protein n=1 Tax=Nocardia farcinica TaxID=37329 RepID=UPI0024561411
PTPPAVRRSRPRPWAPNPPPPPSGRGGPSHPPRHCRDEGAVTTVRLQPDGSLAYSTPGLFGGSIAGILRRG